MSKLAVVFLGYNRPYYFRMTVQSFAAQNSVANLDISVFFALDFSTDDCQREMAIFAKSFFPDAKILKAKKNIGVFRNFHQAEMLVFGDLGFDYALFLEDDLILHPDYLQVISRGIDLVKNDQTIGMFAGRGNAQYPSETSQIGREREVIFCDEHNWGFLLTRRAWTERTRLLKEYNILMNQIEYRERNKHPNKAKIEKCLLDIGINPKFVETSQDSVKNAALKKLGFKRLATFCVFGQYIGVIGEHSNQSKFRKKNHHEQYVFYDRGFTRE